MVHKKNWRLDLCVQELCHPQDSLQSVVNEVTPRDRLVRPDIDSQEGAWPQQFVIGNDEAEL